MVVYFMSQELAISAYYLETKNTLLKENGNVIETIIFL